MSQDDNHITRSSIKDVARLARCAPSTVSLALRDSPKVKPETKRRVAAAARQLNYHPDLSASRLSARRSRVIGVMVPPMSGDLDAEIVAGITDYLQERDFSLLVEVAEGGPDRAVVAVRRLIGERVDGVLLRSVVAAQQATPLQQFQRSGIPLVQIDVAAPGVVGDYVASDNEGGARRMVEYLIERGHRTVAFASGELGRNTLEERLQGYRRALAAHGLEGGDDLVISNRCMDLAGSHTVLSGGLLHSTQESVKRAFAENRDQIRALVQQFFVRGQVPTAIFVAHLGPITPLLWALGELGWRVPQDVSVAAFDGWSFLTAMGVEVATMIQPGFEMGREAAQLLVERIEGQAPAHFQAIRLATKLVEGNTVGPL